MIYNFLSEYLSIIIFLFIAFIIKEYRTEGSIFVNRLMLIYYFLDDNHYQLVAGVTGLEPATSCVTGRRSNQTELHPHFFYLMVGGKGLEPMTLSV